MRPRRALCLLLLCAAAAAPLVRACTSALVGKACTDDGSWFLARTVDFELGNITGNLLYHPARNRTLVFRSAVNAFSLALPAPGLAYLAAPSTNPLNAPQAPPAGAGPSFEEVGVNSAGLAVSATETTFHSNASLAADPLNLESGITEDDIPSIILPQARTAREAVQLLGRLIEEHGSAEGFGVQFADATESWYLENGAGHHWLAQRIPDDAVFVSANQMRFQEVDLSSNETAPDSLTAPGPVLSSPGVAEWAAAAGLWDPDTDGPFSWFKVFAENSTVDTTANWPRVRTLYAQLADFTFQQPGALPPVFIMPARSLGLADVMSALRSHFDGTAQDVYLHETPAEMLTGEPGEPWRPVAMLTTGIAHVTRMRAPSKAVPPGLAVLNYISLGTPAWTPFVPIYAGLPANALPPEMQGVAYSAPFQPPRSLFWRSRRLSTLLFYDWTALGPAVEAAVRAFDADVEAHQRPAFEARYAAAVAAGDQAAADAQLVAFTRGVASQAGALLDRLAAKAAAKLGLPSVPPDAELLPRLLNFTQQYLFDFEPDDSSHGG